MEVGKRLNAGRELSEHKKQKYKGVGNTAGKTFNFDDNQLQNIKTILNNRLDPDIADQGKSKLAKKFQLSRQTPKPERTAAEELSPHIAKATSRNFHQKARSIAIQFLNESNNYGDSFRLPNKLTGDNNIYDGKIKPLAKFDKSKPTMQGILGSNQSRSVLRARPGQAASSLLDPVPAEDFEADSPGLKLKSP